MWCHRMDVKHQHDSGSRVGIWVASMKNWKIAENQWIYFLVPKVSYINNKIPKQEPEKMGEVSPKQHKS